MILSPHEVAFLVAERWQRREPRLIMTAICLAESEGDTDATHRSSDSTSESFGQWDHGLTQISGRWAGDLLAEFAARGLDWRDPRVNLDMARRIYDDRLDAGGDPFHAWTTYVHGTHRKWLPDARWGLENPFPPPPYHPTVAVPRLVGRLEP